jgi:hypothetical protein
MLQESILTDRPCQPQTTLQPEAELARNRNRKKIYTDCVPTRWRFSH